MYQTEISTENRMAWDASTEAAYWQRREQQARSDVEEITLAAFMDAIAVMYPKDWEGDAHSETFKLAEMYCGDVAYIFAKVDDRYFKFRDVVTLSHSAILARINKEVLSVNTDRILTHPAKVKRPPPKRGYSETSVCACFLS